MTSVRTLPFTATPFRRNTVAPHPQWPLFVAAAIFLTVLIADIVIIAWSARNLVELGSLYVTST